MCCTTQNVLPISKMFELAREKKLEGIGLRPLPQKAVWDFSEEAFPDQPFFLRGEEANRIFSWNEELMQHWNNGAVDIDDFVRSENGLNKVETLGSRRPERVAELLASRTVSFELPRDNLLFQPYPNVDVMSTACIAAQGNWFTGSHIEWFSYPGLKSKILKPSKIACGHREVMCLLWDRSLRWFRKRVSYYFLDTFRHTKWFVTDSSYSFSLTLIAVKGDIVKNVNHFIANVQMFISPFRPSQTHAMTMVFV